MAGAGRAGARAVSCPPVARGPEDELLIHHGPARVKAAIGSGLLKVLKISLLYEHFLPPLALEPPRSPGVLASRSEQGRTAGFPVSVGHHETPAETAQALAAQPDSEIGPEALAGLQSGRQIKKTPTDFPGMAITALCHQFSTHLRISRRLPGALRMLALRPRPLHPPPAPSSGQNKLRCSWVPHERGARGCREGGG